VRLFIALDVSEEVRARVAEAVTRERSTVDAKWARTEGLHITLVFFGELEADRLGEIVATTTRIASRFEKLSLEIKGAGTFAGKKPRVLWLGVTGEVKPLAALATELGAALGVVSEHPDFTPHLTLARSIPQRGDPMLNEVAERLARKKFGKWDVEHLTVYESAGGRYRPLATIRLGG
jgi:RNA 2',3'-cyclic 3'-phosphodiesterase